MRLVIDTPEVLDKLNLVSDSEMTDRTAQMVGEVYLAFIEKLLTPVSELQLSVRAANMLKRYGLKNVLDLRALYPDEIEKFRQCGRMVRREMRDTVLRGCGVRLPNWEEKLMKSEYR